MKNLDELRDQMEQKFKSIKWSHHPCGRGSVFENTEITRTLLERFTKKYNIETVSDAGAGDLSWVDKVDWDVTYTPYDIRKWHPDIIEFDVTKDVLPKTDLIVCRHVLNHLPGALGAEAIHRFVESESTYLFMTYRGKSIPFNMSSPIEIKEEEFPGGSKWIYGFWRIDELLLKNNQ